LTPLTFCTPWQTDYDKDLQLGGLCEGFPSILYPVSMTDSDPNYTTILMISAFDCSVFIGSAPSRQYIRFRLSSNRYWQQRLVVFLYDAIVMKMAVTVSLLSHPSFTFDERRTKA